MSLKSHTPVFISGPKARAIAGGLSDSQTRRLEQQGKFPRRVRIGLRRIAYLENEIAEHVRALVAAREAPSNADERKAPQDGQRHRRRKRLRKGNTASR